MDHGVKVGHYCAPWLTLGSWICWEVQREQTDPADLGPGGTSQNSPRHKILTGSFEDQVVPRAWKAFKKKLMFLRLPSRILRNGTIISMTVELSIPSFLFCSQTQHLTHQAMLVTQSGSWPTGPKAGSWRCLGLRTGTQKREGDKCYSCTIPSHGGEQCGPGGF